MPQQADRTVEFIYHPQLGLHKERNCFVGAKRLLHHNESDWNEVIMNWTGLVAFFHRLYLIKPPSTILWARWNRHQPQLTVQALLQCYWHGYSVYAKKGRKFRKHARQSIDVLGRYIEESLTIVREKSKKSVKCDQWKDNFTFCPLFFDKVSHNSNSSKGKMV